MLLVMILPPSLSLFAYIDCIFYDDDNNNTCEVRE